MTTTSRSLALSLSFVLASGCGLLFGEPALDTPAQVQFEAQPHAAPTSSSRSSFDYSRAGEAPLDAQVAEADLHGRLRVAPDRALLRMRAIVPGATREATVERAPTLASTIEAAIASEPGCSARIEEMTAAHRVSDERWQSTLLYTADVSLEGLAGVVERHARIERCLGRIAEALAPHDGVELRVSAPLLTLDDPSVHRAALLRAAVESRAAVAAEIERAPLGPGVRLTPARCHTSGTVTLGERTLAGIALSIDLSCQADLPETASAPAAAPADPQAS